MRNRTNVALAFAAIVVSVLAWTRDPFDYEPKEDSAQYHRLAKNFVERGVLSNQSDAPYKPSMRRVPGYPLFLSSLYASFGPSVRAAKLTQCIVFPPLIYLLTLTIASCALTHQRSAQLTAFLAAITPTSVYANNRLLTESFFTVLLLVAVALLYTWSDRLQAKWAIAFGAVCGTLALTKPESALFVVAGTVVVLLMRRQAGKAVWQGTIALVVAGLFITPWVVRNRRTFGEWKIQGGTVEEGVGDGAGLSRHYRLRAENGIVFRPERFKYFYGDDWKAAQERFNELKNAEVANPQQSDFAFWIAHPALLAKYCLVRFYGLWQPASWSEVFGLADDFGSYLKRDAHLRFAGKFAFLGIDAIILLLGSLGVFVSLLSRFHRLWPITGTILYFVIVYSLLHGISRYRMPLMPLLIIIGVWLILLINQRLSEHRNLKKRTVAER